MRRTIQYLSVAILTFAVGAGLYLVLSNRRHPQPKREPPVAFVPDEMNKGARCLENTAYVWERQEDVESGVVNPFCAGAQLRLLKAASDGDVEGARAALSQGASPNSPGWTEERFYYETHYPLVQAAWGGHAEVVKLLLDNGARVDKEYCCCMSCMTPLAAAVEGGHARFVGQRRF